MPIQKQRAQDIDVLRCFGITLMVTGHIYIGELFDIFIHAFHMPMFFIISGMFFRIKPETSFSEFLHKKAQSLLVPYALFGVFHYMIWLLLNGQDPNLQCLKNLLFFTSDGVPIAGALWFLTGLFIADTLYFLICRYLQAPILQNTVIVLIALFGCFARDLFPFSLPWSMGAACVGVGLMHIGRLLYQSDKPLAKRLLHMKLSDIFICGALVTVLIFVNGYVNMRQGTYQCIPLFWLNSVLATLCGLGIAQYTVKWAPKWAVSYLADIGRNSIVFVCLNQLILMLVDKPLNLVDLPASRLILLVLSMVIMDAIAKILSHPKLKFLIGR